MVKKIVYLKDYTGRVGVRECREIKIIDRKTPQNFFLIVSANDLTGSNRELGEILL